MYHLRCRYRNLKVPTRLTRLSRMIKLLGATALVIIINFSLLPCAYTSTIDSLLRVPRYLSICQSNKLIANCFSRIQP